MDYIKISQRGKELLDRQRAIVRDLLADDTPGPEALAGFLSDLAKVQEALDREDKETAGSKRSSEPLKYRMLEKSDVLQPGDEMLYFGDWVKVDCDFGQHPKSDGFRRPILPAPADVRLSKRTPEPWKVSGRVAYDASGTEVLRVNSSKSYRADEERIEDRQEALHRAVACVNACAGMSNPSVEIHKLRTFKAYVHCRLDEMGIPSDPQGPHSQQGCRIGDRLDIVQRRLELMADLPKCERGGKE